MNVLLFSLQLMLFLIPSATLFTLPGIFLLDKSKIKFNAWEKIILGTVVGLILFSLLSYLLLVIKLHFLVLPIMLAIALLTVKKLPSLFHQLSNSSRKKLALFLIVFSIGIAGQLLIISPSGINLNGDLVFWSSHGHDGLWHISLMEEYERGYPLQNPVFAGERLVNYHFFSDIAPSDFNHYFKLSTLDLYFRFFPLIFSVLLGSLAYLVGVKIGGSFQAGIWATIFTYFAGSFGYIVTFLQNRTIGGEAVFWASQPQSSIGNPPQIVAFIIVLTFLYLFSFFIAKPNKVLFFICVLLAGCLAVFKIYGGITLILSLGIVGLWQLVRERKPQILLLAGTSALLSAILYFPNASNTGSFLIFEPWWFIRTMIVAPNKLNWIDLELKRQTYSAEGNFKRVIQIEVTGFLLFFFGNLGMRFLGLFSFIKLLKSFFSNYFHMIIVSITITSLLLPLLFLQKGVVSNTIQFLQYLLLLLGILSGITTAKLLGKIKFASIKIIVSALIIIVSIPTQVSLIYEFYNRHPFAKISVLELGSLDYLKKNTPSDSVILTPPYNKYLDLKKDVPNIWDWSDTGYVSALSSRRTYLADLEQVDIMGYNFKNRLEFQKAIFSQTNPGEFEKLLRENRINYLYFPTALRPQIDLSKTNLKKAYLNSDVEIWKIQ